MSLENITKWALQVAEALEFLHSDDFLKKIHRDIKPSIMFIEELTENLKICDLSLPNDMHAYNDGQYKSKYSTPYYMAPELYEKNPFSEPCDIYSWSLSFWHCLTKELPFGNCESNLEIFFMKTNKNHCLKKISSISDTFNDLIQDCSKYEPKERPVIGKVIETMKNIQLEIQNQVQYEPVSGSTNLFTEVKPMKNTQEFTKVETSTISNNPRNVQVR